MYFQKLSVIGLIAFFMNKLMLLLKKQLKAIFKSKYFVYYRD